MHAAADLSFRTVTVSAERVDGSTPGVRVTWSTGVPPECVASVRVEFRTGRSGRVMRSYTTTSTTETEVILTGLQCGTTYYIRVVVSGVASLGALSSNQVFFGGEVTACIPSVIVYNEFCTHINFVTLCYAISQIYQSQSE